MTEIERAPERSPQELWCGRPTAPIEAIELRAGPTTALLHDGDLRHVRLGDTELAQRIYVAVRDEVWNTIPGVITDLDLHTAQDGFEVRFARRHRHQDIDFVWQARICGAEDGTVSYEMNGAPQSKFRYAKIGLNVHHPLPECLGRPYRADGRAGELAGTLPVDIEPQLIVDGELTALFGEYRAIAIDYAGGLEVRFDFEGDLFELQDHRNWTDANLKSYGTPMSVGWPVDARPGEQLRQYVRLSFTGPRPRPAHRRSAITVEVDAASGRFLAPIGLGVTGFDENLSAAEVELLARTRPDHLRLDLELGAPGTEDELTRGASAARALRAGLELAIFATPETVEAAGVLAGVLESERVDIARVLVFEGGPGLDSTSAATTPASLLGAIRARLGRALVGVPFAVGTNQFFAELNRQPPATEGVDGIVYSLNPQVHAADDLSLVENLQAQAATVLTAGRLGAGLPVSVSPVTLVGRHGPFPAGPPEPGELPGSVDVRHASLFGAAWTVGSVAELTRTGVGSITYYECAGPGGLLQPAAAPRDHRHPVRPGEVLPVYHVFADLAELKGARVLESRSGDPLSIVVLALESGTGRHVLMANVTPHGQTVSVSLPEPCGFTARTLDASVALTAMRDPGAYRVNPRTSLGRGDTATVEMEPFAFVRMDAIPTA